MSCLSPLIRIDSDFYFHSEYAPIFKAHFPFKRYSYRGGVFFGYDTFFNKFDSKIDVRDKLLLNDKVSLIPCGCCRSCLLKYSKDLAMRVAIECENFPFNYFITLTYDDNNIKYNDYVSEDKEVFTMPILVKRDIQLFIKRLRKSLDCDLKYFLCGEFGSTTARPHYHIILMSNKEICDLDFVSQSNGNVFYNSNIFSNLWCYGFHTISTCNINTIFYTSHYCLKKVGNEKIRLKDLEGNLFQNEFFLMSKGVAKNYFIDKVIPNYLDLTTFKYKDYDVEIRSLKYFDYLYKKFDVWRPVVPSLDKKVLLYNNSYLEKKEIETFKQKCLYNDSIIYRNMI